MSSNNNTLQEINVFIPFIESVFKSTFIKKIFSSKSLGKIVSIELHDKKIVGNGQFKSAKHNYAFITIKPFDTMIGKNLIRNIQNNITTRVLFTHYGKSVCWEIKQHLSIETRIKKGFKPLIFSNTGKSKTNIEIEKYITEIEPTYETKNEENPEWIDYPLDTKFEFAEMPSEISSEFPFQDICYTLLQKPSVFRNNIERLEIEQDYNDIQCSINLFNHNHFTLPINSI
jgi:hypothetical protein